MATNRKDVILPTRFLIKIGIGLKDVGRFKEIFWSDKIYKFHVKNKTVVGKNLIFDVRAMRVNEFVDILDQHNIEWKKFD